MNKLLKFGVLAGILAFLFIGCDQLAGNPKSPEEDELVDNGKKVEISGSINAVEEDALAAGIKDVKTYISSEEELVKAITDAIGELSVLAGEGTAEESHVEVSGSNVPVSGTSGSPYARSANTADAASAQVKQFIDALLEQYSSLQNSLKDVSDISQAKFKINFDEKLDIGTMSSLEWRNAVSEAIKYIINIGRDPSKPYTADPLAGFDENAKTLGFNNTADFYAFIDEVLLFKKAYLNVKSNVNFDGSKISPDNSAKIGYVRISTDVAFAALDVEKAANRANAAFAGDNAEQISVPVKAITLEMGGNVSLASTYADLAAIMEIASSGSSVDYGKLKNLKSSIDYTICSKTALCTQDGLGGIVGLDVYLNMNTADILKFAENSGSISSPDSLLPYLDDVVLIKVSVSDGTTDTFSKEYKPSEVFALVAGSM